VWEGTAEVCNLLLFVQRQDRAAGPAGRCGGKATLTSPSSKSPSSISIVNRDSSSSPLGAAAPCGRDVLGGGGNCGGGGDGGVGVVSMVAWAQAV